MLAVGLETPHMGRFAASFLDGHRKSLERAVKGESYRLFRSTQAFLRQGVGPPTSGLTRKLQRGKRGRTRAMAFYAPMVAYEVRRKRGRYVSDIGLATQAGLRKRPVPLGSIRAVVKGSFNRPITRADQAKIAARLRKRGYGSMLDDPARRRGKRGRLIPQVGTTIRWPRRDFVQPLIRRETRHSQANIAMLYGHAQRGHKWARTWWATEGRGAKPSSKGYIHKSEFREVDGERVLATGSAFHPGGQP